MRLILLYSQPSPRYYCEETGVELCNKVIIRKLNRNNQYLYSKLHVIKGGDLMSKHKNRGTKAPGVNPQGYGQDAELTESPKSKLENAAKKDNTK